MRQCLLRRSHRGTAAGSQRVRFCGREEKVFNNRSARRLSERRRTEKAAQERELLEELERAHSPAARRLAERARDRALEAFVSRFRHELAKAAATLPQSLERIVEEVVQASVPAGRACSAEAEQATAAYDLSMKIFDSAQGYARAYRPSFKTNSARSSRTCPAATPRPQLDADISRLMVEVNCEPDLPSKSTAPS